MGHVATGKYTIKKLRELRTRRNCYFNHKVHNGIQQAHNEMVQRRRDTPCVYPK